jgi:hypothetical protein
VARGGGRHIFRPDTKASHRYKVRDLSHVWPVRESWLVRATDFLPLPFCTMEAEYDRKDDVSIGVTLQYGPSSGGLSVSAGPGPNKDKLTGMIVLIDGYAAMRLDAKFYEGVSSGDPMTTSPPPPGPI